MHRTLILPEEAEQLQVNSGLLLNKQVLGIVREGLAPDLLWLDSVLSP